MRRARVVLISSTLVLVAVLAAGAASGVATPPAAGAVPAAWNPE